MIKSAFFHNNAFPTIDRLACSRRFRRYCCSSYWLRICRCWIWRWRRVRDPPGSTGLLHVSNHLTVPLPLVLPSLVTRLYSSKLETIKSTTSTTLFLPTMPGSRRIPISRGTSLSSTTMMRSVKLATSRLLTKLPMAVSTLASTLQPVLKCWVLCIPVPALWEAAQPTML